MTNISASLAQDVDVLALFERLREASRADQQVSYAVRRDRLDRAIAMMAAHGDRLCRAMSADFGTRPEALSIGIDVAATIESLKAARRKLRAWMRPERRAAAFPMGLFGVRAEVRYRPLGVVCILGTWNFPVATVTAPLAGVLAAGNRAIVKPSEMCPRSAEALAAAIAEFFAPDEVAVVTGDASIGRQLTSLPFDRIVFTGGTATARHIMRSAADNLVPLTLELGGKSPVIVGRSADLSQVATELAVGKLVNAGQACVAPDYVFAPKELREPLIEALKAAMSRMAPRLQANPDYCSIATDGHRDHLQSLLADAREKGAREVVVNPAGEPLDSPGGKILPRILLDVDDTMSVMQKEIFGPILPVLVYDQIDEAVAYVNARPRPLALYYFGYDAREREDVLSRTLSGGVAINATLLHTAMEHLPFGGVGQSGFGKYRGIDGFREFSTAQAVVRQSRWNLPWKVMQPPYTPMKLRILRASAGK